MSARKGMSATSRLLWTGFVLFDMWHHRSRDGVLATAIVAVGSVCLVLTALTFTLDAYLAARRALPGPRGKR